MGRVIDADAFDERIRLAVGSCEEELTEDFKNGISTVLEMMKTAPTVDAVPVVHGQWIDKDGGIATCSVCGDRWGVWSVMKYCPNCGAKMDGKDGKEVDEDDTCDKKG